MKRYLPVIGILALALVLTQTASFAGHGGWKGDHGKYGQCKKSLEDKFEKKAQMICLHKDELGITDKQMDRIKELKTDLKKDLIMKKAEIDVLKIDIYSHLHKAEVDVEAVNKLIDQKYEAKKAKSKKIVESYAALKKVLTKEQMEKLKSIYHEKKKACAAKK
ncbi:Spy/CpxP family protein refolding chaperone [Candidatus Omnitrophota bacterium]